MMIDTKDLARAVKEPQRLILMSADLIISGFVVDEIFFVRLTSLFWSPLSWSDTQLMYKIARRAIAFSISSVF